MELAKNKADPLSETKEEEHIILENQMQPNDPKEGKVTNIKKILIKNIHSIKLLKNQYISLLDQLKRKKFEKFLEGI